MSPPPRPAAVPFDPGSGELPDALEPVLAAPDWPILLIVAAEADDEAGRAAIALADARGRLGLRTVLADADLDAPRLHRLLDVDNLEGVADVFLFGASLGRVTVRPEGHAFDFAPAGAYAPDPAEVLGSPRWERITEELKPADTLMLVFVPAAAPGAAELSRRVGGAVVLGDDRAAEGAAARLDPECSVLAVLAPAAGPAAAEPEAELAGATPVEEAPAAPRPVPPALRDPDLTEPVVFRSEPVSRRTSPVLLVALLIALAAAAWFAYDELLAGRAPRSAPAAPAAVAAPERGPGSPVERAIPVSVAVEAHQDLESATARLRQLERSQPRLTFYIAPVSVRGDVYYRVLAGPAADREGGEALLRRLVDAGIKTSMDSWAVLSTTHAFVLGEYAAAPEARARVRSLGEAGIPAYLVPVDLDNGGRRFRVYGGAFQNEAEAEVMREMLENAGEEARLVARTGEPSA